MIKILADALVPIFAGLLLGYISGLRGTLDNQNVKTLITFVMSFAIPCALFLSIARTPRAALQEQAWIVLVLIIAYGVIYGLSFFWARNSEKLGLADSAVLALTTGFPNSAAVGLPLLASIYGAKSQVTVATSIALGSVTITALTLAILAAARDRAEGGLSFRYIAISLLRSVKKPIVWAPLLGLAFTCAGLQLPSYVDRSLTVMATASAGSALVLTGLVVSAQKLQFGPNTLVTVFLKNLLQPALALGIAMLLHLSIEQTRYVTLIGAIPCGFFGVVFGKGFNAVPRQASSGLIASYGIGVATLALWIVIVNHLG